ncbi:MAG: formate dehydrogenase-N subunit alpha, partial [Chloroflexota bacterium]
AQLKGAKVICVDPRFTRSAARADLYAPMRSGTDIAFVGGMIKYVIDDIERNPQNYNLTYIMEYTNASHLVNTSFKGPAEMEGLFSGYAGALNEADEAKKKYDKSSWAYQLDDKGLAKRDRELKDPNCVFQLMKKHFSRYTPEMVSRTTGCPQDKFLEVCRLFATSGAKGKAGTILYAMGTAQHTVATQNIRAYSILQLLLANIGVAGGGINAMRGESNVQGSTDHGLLFDYALPGYLKLPFDRETTLATFLDRVTTKSADPLSLNFPQNMPKYVISLLKAWYGDAATKDNEFGFNYLPKLESGKNYSHIALFEAMDAGIIKGFSCWGQNPAVGGPDAELERSALSKLDWLVVTDLWHTETADFWHRPGAKPAEIKTEVFLLPALASFEKEGSVTNSGRWMQWRYRAASGPGDAEDDLWMMDKIVRKLKELYAAEGGPNAEAITKLTWDYGAERPDVHKVAKEINGYDLTTGKLMDTYTALKDDGTTSSGNWLYCNSYVEPDKEPNAPIPGNRASLREPSPGEFNVGMYPRWAWCWPVNRRIIYNRASVDLNGVPWDAEHPVIKWDAANKKWLGDVADGPGVPMAEGGYYPFIMKPDGQAVIFGPGLAEGPFPEHYEPWESPISNPLSKQQFNPMVRVWRPAERGSPEKYPIVASTYRVSEHWQGGQMTRNLTWLNEMMPEPFVEMSEELASEKGVKNGERVVVETARGQVSMVAIVTPRFKPFSIDGKTVHQIGIPWHWGYTGLSTGDSANVLTPHVGDANTMIPEYKAFLCNVRKA